MGKHIDVVTVAKLIRKTLKNNFPETKFRVRSRRYSGGSSIDVMWIDGPERPEVQRVVDRFKGGDFDGREDIYRSESTVATNHEGTTNEVHFGADYIFCIRKGPIEDARHAAEEERIAEENRWRSDSDGSPF